MSQPILFLHGWAMRGAVFDALSDLMGEGFTCVAPDLPGHGAAQGALGLDAAVEEVISWIDRLDRPLLVGWSMGAGIAWKTIARRGTSGIKGLVTVDMSPRMLPDHNWDLGLRAQGAASILSTSERILPSWPRMCESISHRMFAASVPEHTRNAAKELMLAQDPAALRPAWDDLVAMDMRKTIARIDLPYLVCYGAQSCLYPPATAEWIAAQAPDARLECFAGSGHSPHIEEPVAFASALQRFAAELDTGQPRKIAL